MNTGMYKAGGFTLQRLTEHAAHLQTIQKSLLRPGDIIVVKTSNSKYTIHALHGGYFAVSGGWFDRKGVAPMQTTIAGCTWGGSAIKVDVIAAIGLSIEFGNRVITSAVQRIIFVPVHIMN